MINNTNYNKHSTPVWQWVAIFILIAIIIYGVFYYVFLPNQLSYNVTTPTIKTISPSPTAALITRNDPVKGTILADSNGMSLYTFDKDTRDVSNCTGTCSTIWPPFSTSLTTQDSLPLNLTIIKRLDGTFQFAWKGLPIYFYSKDVNPGDVLGDGFGGIWHLIHP